MQNDDEPTRTTYVPKPKPDPHKWKLISAYSRTVDDEPKPNPRWMTTPELVAFVSDEFVKGDGLRLLRHLKSLEVDDEVATEAGTFVRIL